MNRPPLLLLCLLAAGPLAFAQSVPQTDLARPSEEDVVVLSPFIVETGEAETGYLASNTLAGTRLNTSLRDVGAAVSVYTEDFLADIGALKLEDILTYTVSTEGGGINGNFSSITGTRPSSDEVRDNPSSINRVRALATATRTRDYFPTDIPSDNFNFGSLTISRGPNSVLAGIGSAGGVIDTAMRQASFWKDTNRFALRLGSFGTHRQELDVNKIIVPNRLAVRVSLLNERDGYRQDPAYEKDRRAYFAMNLRLRDPAPSSFFGRTTLRAGYEVGQIEGIPPDPLTPLIGVDSWFNNEDPSIDKWYTTGAFRARINPPEGTGAAVADIRRSNGNPIFVTERNSLNQAPAARGFPIYTNWGLVFADPSQTTPGVGITTAGFTNLQGFQGGHTAIASQGGTGAFSGTGDRNRDRTGFFRTRLTDPNIFNFYKNVLTGSLDTRSQDFDALDVRLEQLMLGGRAGFELALNHQDFESLREFPAGADEDYIYIDTNKFLTVRADGSSVGIPNPNFGRPFIVARDLFRGQYNATDRTARQVTAFYKHDFTESDSRILRWLGRHTLSGLLFQTDIETTRKTFSGTWDPTGELNPLSSLAAAATPGTFNSQVNAFFYLGDSMANANSIDELRLSPLSGARPMIGETYTLRVYDRLTNRFVTGTSRAVQVNNAFSQRNEEVSSEALSLQSHFLASHVVTIFGWRRDESKVASVIQPVRLADGNVDLSNLAVGPSFDQSEESLTKSVVLVYPERWLGNLPFDSDLRVYWNQSGNFNPTGQRRNIFNEDLGSPKAETEEFGIMLSLLGGKIDLRVNRYETAIKSDSIAGVHNIYAYMNTAINNMVAANTARLNPADFGYIHPSFVTFENVARAYFEAIPQRLRDNISAEKNFNPRFTGSGATLGWEPAASGIPGLTSVSDTISEGLEFEVVWNPTRSWRIAMNASKQEASKADVARLEMEAGAEWINNVETLYNGGLRNGGRAPATLAYSPDTTALSQFRFEHYNRIQTSNATSGTSTDEIRKWRGNLVTRYEFREGFLKGFSVGGAARWQDRVVIGYPLITTGEGADRITAPDLLNPYYGPEDLAVDLNAGYSRKLRIWGSPVDWSIGLYVRNVGAKDEIIPISANPDGTGGSFRIAPARTWSLSSAFSF
jgi:hypothetical protein